MFAVPQKNKDGSESTEDEEKKSLLTLLVQNVLRNPYIWGMVRSFFRLKENSEGSRCCTARALEPLCWSSVHSLAALLPRAWKRHHTLHWQVSALWPFLLQSPYRGRL